MKVAFSRATTGLSCLLATAICVGGSVVSHGREWLDVAPPAAVPGDLDDSDWASILSAHAAGRHAFHPVENGLQARNPGQQWLLTFDRRGFVAEPDGGGWTWGLELQSYGAGGELTHIHGTPEVRTDGERISYHWNATIQEWFVNDARGLEHGFSVQSRPAGPEDEPLVFVLGIRGSLKPSITADATGVEFLCSEGRVLLTYTGLKVWDADGRFLPSRFAPGEAGVRLLVDARGARYPVTIDPIAQQAYLKASNAGAGDYFGFSVAVSGDTVVVGAPGEDSSATGIDGGQADNTATDSGAAYVFVRSGSGWTQQAYLKPANTGAHDNFGTAVAISGDTIVVGAPAEDSNAVAVNGNGADNSAAESGAAYVFVRHGATWSQQGYVKASNTGAADSFGYSVSVSGDTMVVGAYLEDSDARGINGNQVNDRAGNSGAAYVFVRNAGAWSQQSYLKASNTGAGHYFGKSVALDGDTILAGAKYAGAAYAFVRSGSTWAQQALLTPAPQAHLFGGAVAVSGNTAVVGAVLDPGAAAESGAAYVFERAGTAWTQQAHLKALSPGVSDLFGVSVGVSGDTVVVGAQWEDSSAMGVDGNEFDNSLADSGAAYVFLRSGSRWTQQGYLKASNHRASSFGGAVAVSGNTVVSGAYLENNGATGIGGSQTGPMASRSGAAWIFEVPDGLAPSIGDDPAPGGRWKTVGLGATAATNSPLALMWDGYGVWTVSNSGKPQLTYFNKGWRNHVFHDFAEVDPEAGWVTDSGWNILWYVGRDGSLYATSLRNGAWANSPIRPGPFSRVELADPTHHTVWTRKSDGSSAAVFWTGRAWEEGPVVGGGWLLYSGVDANLSQVGRDLRTGKVVERYWGRPSWNTRELAGGMGIGPYTSGWTYGPGYSQSRWAMGYDRAFRNCYYGTDSGGLGWTSLASGSSGVLHSGKVWPCSPTWVAANTHWVFARDIGGEKLRILFFEKGQWKTALLAPYEGWLGDQAAANSAGAFFYVSPATGELKLVYF